MDEKIKYINIDGKKVNGDINTIFPGWQFGDERVCVFSPHDDDAIIGAGYAIEASVRNNAEVCIFIFCSGNAGYSSVDRKEEIAAVRKIETIEAYERIGIKKENIVRFEYFDFSAFQEIGLNADNGSEGSFREVLTALRDRKITRILVPNHYREHIDHLAVSIMGSFYAPQQGDPVLVDWGRELSKVASVLQYPVWADLSPEDSLVEGRRPDLRANRIIMVEKEIEKKICGGISQYKSQEEIIKALVESRSERVCYNGHYIEVYLLYDPRPKLDYRPYKEFVEDLGA